MQREMTKTEKILDNVVLTNLGLIAVAISTIFMHENDVNSMPIIIRRIFSFFTALHCRVFVAKFWNHAHCWVLECSTRNSFRRA